jgi:predicted dehydrogenase
MEKVRIGVVGIGGMGSNHAKSLASGKVANAELTAVCDVRSERLDWARTELGGNIKLFEDADAFFAAAVCDAVIVATPHYDHSPLGIKGFEHDLHVMIEKPAGVYTKQVREINEVAAKSPKVFGIMYNQRTRSVYKKLKSILESGELGEIRRTNWIITSWYRPQSYFDSGGWRASWSGEGGGVLLNQCPHQLDLWQWMCGMPKRVRAFLSFGKYHDIEVEDDVTAYVEYPNGGTGVFITTTADTPGTNRLEITGDKGKIVVENDSIVFWRLETPERQFNAEWKGGFGEPKNERVEIPVDEDTEGQHEAILNNWVSAILRGDRLIAPGEEGINGLSISNAMHLSSWLDKWVELPLDEELYLAKLKERIETSTFKKATGDDHTMEVKGSFR